MIPESITLNYLQSFKKLVMNRYYSVLFGTVFFIFTFTACEQSNSGKMNDTNNKRVAFLHHSTGNTIWRGGKNLVTRIKGKLGMKSAVEAWFENYNRKNNKNYIVESHLFPKKTPYGWTNYPYDYYNIWVKNGDSEFYMEEPTLRTLTSRYDLIVFKHCFPGSKIVFDGTPDIDSDRRMIENYKMQYHALKEEMYKYPETLFLVWTLPALTESVTNPEAAAAASGFSNWMMQEWDQPGDNIFIWDFRTLETRGGDYLLPENAISEKDSHPSHKMAQKAYLLFCKRVTDVLEGRGDEGA
jgi:hypothetical protein